MGNSAIIAIVFLENKSIYKLIKLKLIKVTDRYLSGKLNHQLSFS